MSAETAPGTLVLASPLPGPEYVDFYSLQCERLLGIAGWRWFRVEAVVGGTLVTGAVCTETYKSGKRKGSTNWSKRDMATERRVVLSDVDMYNFRLGWENETGKCHECSGKWEPRARISNEGRAYRPCRRCSGSGMSPGTVAGGAR